MEEWEWKSWMRKESEWWCEGVRLVVVEKRYAHQV